jgi:hyaluronan synthase
MKGTGKRLWRVDKPWPDVEVFSAMTNLGLKPLYNGPIIKGNANSPELQCGKLLILLGIGLVTGVTMTNLEEIDKAKDYLWELKGGAMFLVLGTLFLAANLSALVWRVVLFFMYRPAKPCSLKQLPFCSVIVPAYNEGQQVLLTLRSLAQSDYPAEKLQIIAVDDGSVDDTWDWICKAREELGTRVMAIRTPSNQGKRHALFSGINESKGDVIVTVDSDSIVEPQTLWRLVSPFVHDKRVGAVAGNVRVLNCSEGIIARMLDVTFFYSFDFLRASQSMVNTVVCTPGALSAYRSKLVMRVLPQWMRQTFCGRPANIGEDRAMTNLILREGYHVLFQQDAIVYTKVPVRYKNLCRMFLRWARSNFRETIVMSSFAFRRFRKGSMLGARINLLLSWMVLTNAQVLFVYAMASIILDPTVYASQILTGVILSSSLPAGLYCWRRHSSEGLWAYLYSLFWLLALSWITPYALLTPHKNGWLTRRIVAIPPSFEKGYRRAPVG